MNTMRNLVPSLWVLAALTVLAACALEVGGDTVTPPATQVDRATSFDSSQPGEYTIEFLSPRISHVARAEEEMAHPVDELGPVTIPANRVTVQINLTATAAPSSTSRPEPTPRPTRTLVLEGKDQDGEGAQLIIHEMPIVEAKVIGPGRFEYADQLGGEILARIQALRDRAAERSLARANAFLAPFGYRLESRFDPEWNRTFHDLYRKGENEPLLHGLKSILPVSVSASGTGFLLVAENAPNTRPPYLLVEDGQVQSWDPEPSARLPPAYVGDALARITTTGFPTITYQVELGGPAVHNSTAVVYTGTAVAVGAYMPLRSFTTWDEHWVLEVDDHLIMDGIDLGPALGYNAAFGFARIGEQSFYFFEQDGQVQISYGDQVLPNAYETVFHNQCCEASIHNVETGPDAVWFHALREGVWYFVEARLDVESAEVAPSACASWQATYFDDTRGYNAPPVVKRDDAQIDFDWGHGAPAPGMVADHFSVRWQCTAQFRAGTYRFTATSDDGLRLYVDGQPVVDAWFDHPVRTFTGEISLAEGDHEVIAIYYENTGVAVAKVSWAPVDASLRIPASSLPGGQRHGIIEP